MFLAQHVSKNVLGHMKARGIHYAHAHMERNRSISKIAIAVCIPVDLTSLLG
jgi:hypothetical protein